MNIKSLFYCAIILQITTLSFAGCSKPTEDTSIQEPPSVAEPSPEPSPEPMSEPEAADLLTLLASSTRAEADRARDAGRKPAEVIEFLGIEPGMRVIDVIAAGGYYTEVLSLAVGSGGHVVAQNPPAILEMRDGANETAISERLAGNRLANVSRMNTDLTELAGDGQFDAGITALNLHDIYNNYGEEGAVGALKMIHAALKPGGVFGVIDHDGAPENDNVALHRMEKATAIQLAEAAGFVVEGDSGILHVHSDDLSQGVFAEGVRGKTKRFLLRLRKPAS